MATKTQAEVKRLVIGGRKTSGYSTPKLFLAEHDGQLYATNSYWLVPVGNVAPLLAHYNLAADKPATFEVNGKVQPVELDPPNIGPLMPANDAPEITRIQVAGRDAYARGDTKECAWLALFDHAGETVAFNVDFLDFIDHGGDVAGISQGYGSRLVGPAIYRQEKPGKPVAVYAKCERQTGGHNDASGHYIKAEWVDDGELFLGLLMPVRLQSIGR